MLIIHFTVVLRYHLLGCLAVERIEERERERTQELDPR
jgi:hypothetical protein